MKRETQTEPTPFLVWDTCEILTNQAKYLVEQGEAVDEDAGFKMACEDPNLTMCEWAYLIDELTETLDSINPDGNWSAKVENFGWRNSSGTKDFHAENGSEFLSNLLPKTDCTFSLYIENGHTIKINNFHHDSPTGEWYTIQAASDELEDEDDEFLSEAA
jgi:hypothetical protein